MTTLNEIEKHLNINTEDMKLRKGKKVINKNKYYKFKDYLIVSLTKDKWMILDNNKKSKNLLKNHCWRFGFGYGRTTKNNKTHYYHKLLLNYDDGLIADHINRCRFDNREQNLRIETYSMNARNTKFNMLNTTGIKGVRKCKGAYRGFITIDNNKVISKSYSFIKWGGEEECKRLATEWRKEKEQQYGYIC